MMLSPVMLNQLIESFYFTSTPPFFGAINNNKTGSKIRLVSVATNNVTDVSQPKDLVPPKLLMQKITKPAISTSDVYTMLKPVLFMVALTVASTSLL